MTAMSKRLQRLVRENKRLGEQIKKLKKDIVILSGLACGYFDELTQKKRAEIARLKKELKKTHVDRHPKTNV